MSPMPNAENLRALEWIGLGPVAMENGIFLRLKLNSAVAMVLSGFGPTCMSCGEGDYRPIESLMVLGRLPEVTFECSSCHVQLCSTSNMNFLAESNSPIPEPDRIYVPVYLAGGGGA